MKFNSTGLTHLILLLVIFFGVNTTLYAQECDAWVPGREGAVWEITSYDAKGKSQGSVTQNLKKIAPKGKTIEYTIASLMKDSKGKETLSTEFDALCENGIFYVNMEKFLDNAEMASLKGMELTVKGDYLELPTSLTVGQTLKDGLMNIGVTVPGLGNMEMNVVIKNRKVEGLEKVSVPAGEFLCYKISSETETKMMMTFTTKSVEWYAKEIGVVRSEVYDKTGKMQGYTELTKFER